MLGQKGTATREATDRNVGKRNCRLLPIFGCALMKSSKRVDKGIALSFRYVGLYGKKANLVQSTVFLKQACCVLPLIRTPNKPE